VTDKSSKSQLIYEYKAKMPSFGKKALIFGQKWHSEAE